MCGEVGEQRGKRLKKTNFIYVVIFIKTSLTLTALLLHIGQEGNNSFSILLQRIKKRGIFDASVLFSALLSFQ